MNPLFISLLLGGFIALLVWQIARFFQFLPAPPRHYLDRPAYGFRLIWPLIKVVVFYLGHQMPETHIQNVSLKLKQAGVDFTLKAEEFLAAQGITAMALGACSLLMFKDAGWALIFILPLSILAGYQYPNIWLRDRTQRRRTAILKALPFYLDVITLAVESGSNLNGGLTQAVQKTADSPLRREISRVLRDIRSGKTRSDALRELTDRTASPAVGQIVTGLIQAEKTGSSLGPMLRVQAEQLRSQRFQYAEKKAMEAPVKLLAPLFIFIFPTTFLTLGFIFISKAILEGFITWSPLVWAYNWPGIH